MFQPALKIPREPRRFNTLVRGKGNLTLIPTWSKRENLLTKPKALVVREDAWEGIWGEVKIFGNGAWISIPKVKMKRKCNENTAPVCLPLSFLHLSIPSPN